MTADANAYHLGIDLGTTYVAAGILEQGRPEIITLGDRTPVLPSVLFFREDGEVLTGESATRRGLSDPTRVVREFKRRVGDTTPVIVGQTPYSVDGLMAKLVRFVHNAVVERQGGQPRSIALTHPANWGPYKIDVLEQAVRMAGIGEVTTVTEPVAAAIHYAAAERLEPGQTVAVYDLGGGTFDAAVLRKTENDFTLLGEVEGIERLGGIDFDEAVFQHVVRFCDSSLAELDVDDPAAIQALARLRQECVEAKEVLSTDTEVTIPVVLPNLQSEVRLTRAEFEAMIRPLLTQTVEALGRAIASAGVDPQELSAVLLVGGCSRIPLISEMVGAELGRPIAVDRHPKHTVALGAAIAAGRSVEAPEPQVDDWFRTEPTTSVPAQPKAGAAAAPVAAAAPAAAVAAAAGSAAVGQDADDPLSMFPLRENATASEQAPAALDSATPPVAEQAPSSNGAAGPSLQTTSPEVPRSRAEQIGTAPIELPVRQAEAAPAAPSVPTPPVGSGSTPPSFSSSNGSESSPLSFSSSNPAPDTASNAALGLHLPGRQEAPVFEDQRPPTSAGSSKSGARILVIAAVAAVAFLVLGGTAWAFGRGDSADNTEIAAEQLGDEQNGGDGGPESPNDVAGGGADSPAEGPATGQRSDGDLGNGGQAPPPGQTNTTAGRTGTTAGHTDNTATDTTAHHETSTSTGESTTTTPATTTTTETTTSTTAPSSTTTATTAPAAEPIRIVGGPRVNSRGPTSFQFSYTTNDVCGTGSFSVTEKASGQPVGSFQGDNVCFGPAHGGFPNGSATFGGFDLSPGTTYRVTVTVRGTASDGSKPAGQGSDGATFEVTTSG